MNKKVIFLSDLHIPYESKESVSNVLKYIKDIKPKMVILGGDVVDFYSVSHFRKDPLRSHKLQDELNAYYKFMDRLRKVFKGELVYIMGNHETRINKYLMENPELHGLVDLRLESLLKTDKYEFELVYEYMLDDFLFTHGTAVTQYCAAKELNKSGLSGISGHKHNHNVASKTNRFGTNTWITAPCLCDFKMQDYVHNPDWQLGFVELTFNIENSLDLWKLRDYKVILL